MQKIKKIIKHLITLIYPRIEYVEVDGSVISSPGMRTGGKEFKDDMYYINSAENEAKKLIDSFQIKNDSVLLDIGCGQGRLPIGLLRTLGHINYIGLDVDKYSIRWCNKYLNSKKEFYKFIHLDLYNERYNKDGAKFDNSYRFDITDSSIDLIYLYSVFSHTSEEDMKIYLNEFSRILKKKGNIFFTTFVEENVPDFTVNPEDYYLGIRGPLHVVRYNKEYLFSIIDDLGFNISKFDHGNEANGQSGLYLKIK